MAGVIFFIGVFQFDMSIKGGVSGIAHGAVRAQKIFICLVHMKIVYFQVAFFSAAILALVALIRLFLVMYLQNMPL